MLALFAAGWCVAVAPVLLEAAAPQGAIEIVHDPPACAAAGSYLRLSACLRPVAELARARVYFRAAGTRDWFYVEMRPGDACHDALLPRPRKDLGRIEYYVSATDHRSVESRTESAELVVTSDGRCAGGALAPAVDTGSVVIGSESGASPAGFLTGGGLATPLLIAGGVAAAGGAVVLLTRGKETPSKPASWQSELRLEGARGQVIVDGSEVLVAPAGLHSLGGALTPGRHRLEATLVEVRGSRASGAWRFDLSALGMVEASLRVESGEVEQLPGASVVFRLRGRAGERVAFTFEVAGHSGPGAVP